MHYPKENKVTQVQPRLPRAREPTIVCLNLSSSGNSVDKVSHFKSLTRLRDFFIKSHEIYETFETLET